MLTRTLRFSLLLLTLAAFASCGALEPAVRGPDREEAIEGPTEAPRIPEPVAEALWVPMGYRAEVVVSGLAYPTSVEFDDKGNMYIAEAGAVAGDPSAPARILRVAPGGEIRVITERLEGPVNDLLWHQGRLYVSHKGRISTVQRNGEVFDVVSDLPSGGDHGNNQMVAGPDGWIYFGQGTATNSGVVGLDNFVFGWLQQHPKVCDVPAKDIKLAGETFTTVHPFMFASKSQPKTAKTAAFSPFGKGSPEKDRVRGTTKSNGTILRMRPDGSDLEVYAWGFRNPYGLAFTSSGRLFATDNGYDERGSRPIANAPDSVWEVFRGAWYGFPDFAGGEPVTDPKFRTKDGPKIDFLLEQHPKVEHAFLNRDPHCSLAKVAVCTSSKFGFKGQLFIAEFGDMTPLTGPNVRSGYQVVRLDPNTREMEVFLRVHDSFRGPEGLEHVQTAGLKRPIDVVFSPDGKALYVVDLGAMAVLATAVPSVMPMEGTGVIWRVMKDDVEVISPPANLSLRPGEERVEKTK